jgi:hypothetical protein
MKHARILPILIVLACGGPPPPAVESTFAIRLDPPVLSLRVSETGSVKVLVSRNGGLTGAVAVSLGGDSTGLDSAGISIAGSEGMLSFRVSDAATLGTRFPIVQASSGAFTSRETLTLHISKAVAEASRVGVRDNAGSNQVRQGTGTVMLDVEGKNLERVTALALGDLAVTVLSGRTSTQLSLSVNVPHGASLGTKPLVLTADGGETTFPAALVVTPLTSGPAGSDAVGVGTSDRPYRTLGKALSLAQAGDTVRLQNGTYSAATGETWPSIDAGTGSGEVPAGVTVEGETAAATVLNGPGPTAGSPNAGLVFRADGGVAHLTLRGFAAAVYLAAGTVVFDGTTATGNRIGLAVGGGVARVMGCELTANEVGVLVTGTASVEVTSSASHDNTQDGVRIGDGTPRLQARDFEASGNGRGLAAGSEASLVLERTRANHNRDHGLEALQGSTVSLTASDFSENAQAGVWFSGRSLALHGTSVRANEVFGLYIEGTPSKIDLGNFVEPGNNDLHGNGPNGMGDQILDVRTPGSVLGDPEAFTLSATELNGTRPPADVYPDDGKWPYRGTEHPTAPYFSILGKNNVISVY